MASVQGETDFNGRLCKDWRLVASTLILLDHLYTLDIEINFLWKRHIKLSGYLFFLHRYFNLLASIFSATSVFIPDFPVNCQAMVYLREAMLIIAQLIVVCILTLRIYALYNRSLRVLFSMLTVLVILLAIACFFTYFGHNDQSQVNGSCLTELDKGTSIRQSIAWIMVFIYDMMNFCLAVYNAFQTRRELRLLRYRASLKVILLRDGAMYFGIMSIINLANILTFYFGEGCMSGGLAPAASSLSVTLISHLMLNLHEVMDIGIYMKSFSTQCA